MFDEMVFDPPIALLLELDVPIFPFLFCKKCSLKKPYEI